MNYFGPIEEQAFRTYLTSTDKKIRDDCFIILNPAFRDLISKQARRLKYRIDEDAIDEVYFHLFENMHKFDMTKNTKAHSWCTTVIYRQLIKRKEYYGKIDFEEKETVATIGDNFDDVRDKYITAIRKHIIGLKTDSEYLVAMALIDLLKDWHQMDFLTITDFKEILYKNVPLGKKLIYKSFLKIQKSLIDS